MVGSQRAKKNAYVTKLKQALSADEASLCEALEPYKRFIAPEHVEEVKKDEKLLGAWVARLTQLLEAEKLEQLYAVILVCNMQVFRCFEEATKTISDSKLIPFLVKCVAALRDSTGDETACQVLECALDMAELVVENQKIRSEFFIPAAADLVTIATNLAHKVSNRRACLEMLRSGIQGSEPNRAALDAEKLTQHMPVCDDFFCQSYIAAIMGKLIQKRKSAAAVMDKLTKAWGKTQATKLKSTPAEKFEQYVQAYNEALMDAVVLTLPCTELTVGDAKFEKTDYDLLLHCSPTCISFNAPLPDSDDVPEVETIDIPLRTIKELKAHEGKVTITVKVATLCDTMQKWAAGAKTVTLKAVAEGEVESWVKTVGVRGQGMKRDGASAAPSSNKRKSRGPEAKEITPPAKVSRHEPPPSVDKTAVSEDVLGLAARLSSRKAAAAPAGARPGLSVDYERKGGLGHEVSPFVKADVRLVEDDADMVDTDMDMVFEQMRRQFSDNTKRRQAKGREGLERTMEAVQRLVDDYKTDASRHDLRLEENVRTLRTEMEKQENDLVECLQRERQLAVEMEQRHSVFIAKSKEQAVLVQAFQEELDVVLPTLKEQEAKDLARLKEMVDEEFTRLEDQVAKIQSQKSMMTKMMRFMMTSIE